MHDTIKMVVVGDCSANKTQLLYNYAKADITNEYCPTIFENYFSNINIENKAQRIQIYDTSGQENYKSFRTTSYGHADVFILCFSLNDKESLSNVKEIWFPEIKNTRQNAKIILVGTTLDHFNRVVTSQNGEDMSKIIDANYYIECNLFDINQVNYVFESAAKAVIYGKRKKKWNFLSKFHKLKKKNNSRK